MRRIVFLAIFGTIGIAALWSYTSREHRLNERRFLASRRAVEAQLQQPRQWPETSLAALGGTRAELVTSCDVHTRGSRGTLAYELSLTSEDGAVLPDPKQRMMLAFYNERGLRINAMEVPSRFIVVGSDSTPQLVFRSADAAPRDCGDEWLRYVRWDVEVLSDEPA